MGDIFATMPETGGNQADILMRFGAARTNVFNRLGNDDLTSTIPLQSLVTANASVRGASRAAQIGALQVRGSGSATATALNSALETLSGLPGGRDSLTYAQTRCSYVDALYSSYQQADVTGYDLPSTRLAGREARAQLLPYSPANLLGLGLQRVNLNRQQIGRLHGRLSSLRASGNLTEDEELRLTSQIESLKTQDAGVVSQLSEGMEDRLPALSAGRPGFAVRLNSMNLAAINIDYMGSPIRGYGAANGRQLVRQKQFVQALGGTEQEVGPHSRMQSFDSLAEVLSRLISSLDRQSATLDRLAAVTPNPMRPTELSGSAYANQQRQNIGQGNVYPNTN